MPSPFDLAEAEIDFASGNELNWSNFTLPIPEDILVFTTDTHKFRVGTGALTFSHLPDVVTVANIMAGVQNVTSVLTMLTTAENNQIISIVDETYAASGTTLSSVQSRIAAIANIDAIQNANISTIQNRFNLLDSSVGAAANGTLVGIVNNKLTPGVTVASITPTLNTSMLNIESIDFFSDELCTVPIKVLQPNSVAYARVFASHDTVDNDLLTYGLTSPSSFVTIASLGRGVFSLTVGTPIFGVSLIVTLTATVSYATEHVTVVDVINTNAYLSIISGVYGGTDVDQPNGITTDSAGNIICVGNTSSDGAGGTSCFVVKFDSNLNILARKVYGGIGSEIFYGVAVDSANNIICVGYTGSEGSGYNEALLIKFDPNLNVLVRKIYGGAITVQLRSVAIDSNNDVIGVGYVQLSGAYQCLVTKFDTNLNVLASRTYDGVGADYFYGVAVDSFDSVICVGSTTSEGSGSIDALVVKFDANLSILYRKVYGGAGDEQFNGVAVDSSNNIICVGWTTSEGDGSNDALVIKFNTSLGVLARKVYGGAGVDKFWGVALTSSNNIVCVGSTGSEGAGGNDALVVKFDVVLNILSRKVYGGTGADMFATVALDPSNNIICAGYANSAGAGGYDALVVKFPSVLPAGTFTGTVLTTLTLRDSALTLADSTLTLANSTLTLANSTLTLADSALTLANSTLTLTKDTIS